MAIGLFDIIDRCLNESVSLSDVEKAIEGKYHVSIHYDDGQEPPRKGKGRRIIQPVAMGTTKRGFPVVRAFQTNGSSRRGAPKWKFFRLDRITSWVPMPNKKFETAPDPAYGEYNRVGDKTMGSFYKNAQFNEPESPLAAVQAKTGDLPLVLHGGTGIPADMIKKAIDLGVSKINVNTECQLSFAAATRKYIEEGKDLEGKGFDPRKLLAPGTAAIHDTVKEKMELFGSVGKAE